jgi:alpha-tubulin suppressor-like RCC1 family protein
VHVPAAVIGVSHATALSVNDLGACAIVSGGSVRCWGYNGQGELGNGTTTDSDLETPVAGITGAQALFGGSFFSCASVARHLFCWGDNTDGEIGDGTTANRLTPTAVAKLSSVTAVATGGYHSIVRQTNGGLRAWGYNAYGELGDGTTTSSPLPVVVG